jgi:hypothetical protein
MKIQDDGWAAIKGQAGKDVIFTKFAYEDSKIKQEELTKMAQEIDPEHKLLLFSDYVKDTQGFEYRCAVFINEKTKEIVFANAGTRAGVDSKGINDLIDDARLIAQAEPNKLQKARDLNNLVMENLGPTIKDYKFHYTGHSLGAAMAQLQAEDMYIKMHKKGIKIEEDKISTITFENPGTKPIIDKMFKEEKLDPQTSKVKHVVFNNRKNFINTLNPQVGKVYEIKPNDQKSLGPIEKALGFIARIISKVVKISSKVITKVCDWVSYGLISRQIKDHSLEHFEKVFVNGDGKIKVKGEGDMQLDKMTAHPPEAKTHVEKEELRRSKSESIKPTLSLT